MLAHWHSRQTQAQAFSTLSLWRLWLAHTDVFSLQDEVDDVDVVDVNSESEQAQKPVHTQKLAQPHK